MADRATARVQARLQADRLEKLLATLGDVEGFAESAASELSAALGMARAVQSKAKMMGLTISKQLKAARAAQRV